MTETRPNVLDPKDIHVFNTGRRYTFAGQRIAWAVLSEMQHEDSEWLRVYDVVFSDLDRIIWGRMEMILDAPVDNHNVLYAYDHNFYEPDPLADQLNGQLRAAARKI